eukprot:TRINITY_DN441_c0_g2_i1.p2 TRINITY_DN441_c0_g2~~TRINITY_DN441_c0_g2_i1.p2  ORF type:complete len:163 (-),score=16.64 TRINITY_DN441_c0_g2_i1:115-603(-)
MSEQENQQMSKQENQKESQEPTPQTMKASQTTASQQVNKVTIKHPGRIAAGNRLAEWNKQKKNNERAKQKLMTNSTNEQTLPPEASPILRQPAKHEPPQIPYKAVGMITLGAGCYLFYTKYMKPKPTKQVVTQKIETEKEQKTPKSQPTKCLKPQHDPFLMH